MKVRMAGKKSENKAVGMSKGGRNTKIHAIVDGLGNPLVFLLSPGNDHDSTHAIPLLKNATIKEAIFSLTRHMAQKKSVIISFHKRLFIQFHRKAIPKNLGMWIGLLIRSAIWSNVFSSR